MKFRFPSITDIMDQGIASLKRFPFVLFVAVIGTVAGVWLAEIEGHFEFDTFGVAANMCWTAALGISYFIAVTTAAESYKWPFKGTLIIKGIVLLLLGGFYYSLPLNLTPEEAIPFYRFLLYFLTGHLLVSFLPFLQKDRVSDFWAYNKTLLFQFLKAVFFSIALFVGLSIAMLSLDNLLEFEISGKRYLQLWIVVVGLFNTWMFLPGIPHPDRLTEKHHGYPSGLKVFVQYILIPLITVYIFILYLYMAKIIWEWEWPNGWVANLVLIFSIAGILAILLLHPIQNEEKNRWIQIFSKGFYRALLPLIILLMLSIWVRISEYGITVNRYLVATLAVWLTGIVLYFIASKNKNIQVIPISLAVIAILISFGPLSAFEVSKRSQLHRLEKLWTQEQLLSENGKVQKLKEGKKVDFDTRKRLSSSLLYIIQLKGVEPLQPYFEEDLSALVNEKEGQPSARDLTTKIMTLSGLKYIDDRQLRNGIGMEAETIFYTKPGDKAMPAGGYDYYLGEFSFNQDRITDPVEAGTHRWIIEFKKQDRKLRVYSTDQEYTVAVDLLGVMMELRERSRQQEPEETPEDRELLTIKAVNEDLEVMVVVRNIRIHQDDDALGLNSIYTSVFLNVADEEDLD